MYSCYISIIALILNKCSCMTQIMRWKLKYVSEIFFVQGDHSTRTKQEPGLIIFMYLYTKFHFNASVRGNEQKMNYDSKDVIKVGIVTENTRPVINLHSDNAQLSLLLPQQVIQNAFPSNIYYSLYILWPRSFFLSFEQSE